MGKRQARHVRGVELWSGKQGRGVAGGYGRLTKPTRVRVPDVSLVEQEPHVHHQLLENNVEHYQP